MIKKIATILIILICFSAKAQEQNYVIKNIKVNDRNSNFGTTFFGDDKVVYASPKKRSYIIRNVWKGNNQPFLDLFIGDIAEDGELIHVVQFSTKLNTRYHEADVAFTKDKKTVYFSRNNYFDKKLTRDSTGTGLIQLYRAQIDVNGAWLNEEPMPFNNDQYQTGHPTLSADEKTLYFISDMPGGFGRTDVYKASIAEDGTIGEPINMGPKINTAEREMFASISGNDELYFSSDGRDDTLGELDIYVSKISETNITEPLNLGAPINSDNDDFAFILNYESRRGYFSSNRSGGNGDDDIYTFTQDIPIVFECFQDVTGVVTERTSGEILPGALVKLFNETGTAIDSVVVGADASYKFKVECNKSYSLNGSKLGYSDDNKDFFSTEGEELIIPLILDPGEFIIENGKCLVRINPIYFDFDLHNIREDAQFELEKVVNVMRKYPELIIEGGSHTDSRGTYEYNNALSSRRAQSTVDYIVAQGINPENISSKGYGETQLVNACSDGARCSEDAHQFNRRTEFVVVNYEEVKDLYPGICPIITVTAKDQILKSQTACRQRLEGVIYEKDSGLPLPNAEVSLFDTNQNLLFKTTSARDGSYSFNVQCNGSFRIEAEKDSYTSDYKEIQSFEEQIIKVDLELALNEFVFKNGNCIININPIYFDFDKSNIRPDAIIELDKVVRVMKKYPDLVIEGGSHTDSRGTFKYNEALSSRRAASTVAYIKSKGISAFKISSKGYGETKTINGCIDGVRCTEKDHQYNRRTEFVVVNYAALKVKYTELCEIRVTSTREQIQNEVRITVDPKKNEEYSPKQVNKQNKPSGSREISAEDFVKENGKTIIKLNTIYFDVNSSYFRADAAYELNKVVEIMIKYPNLKIECGSHTDARASDKYNNWLSGRRAKRSIDYIIRRGINPNRITAVGYGESQLVNKCADGVRCSEGEHQVNRRTEFVVLNMDELNLEKDKSTIKNLSTIEKVIEKKEATLEKTTDSVASKITNEVKPTKNIVNIAYSDQDFVKINEEIQIKLDPIVFDINIAEVNPEIKIELNKVVEIMEKYPSISVACSSHTDSRAGFRYNLKLSNNRAVAMVDYIVSKGIDPNRISGKGFGESQLLNKCSDGVRCSDVEHQKNIRTEFKVLN